MERYGTQVKKVTQMTENKRVVSFQDFGTLRNATGHGLKPVAFQSGGCLKKTPHWNATGGPAFTLVEFDVLGDPEPEPRPRATIVDGKVRIYVPESAHAWKRSIRVALCGALGAQGQSNFAAELPLPKSVAFSCAFEFRFARPKAHYGTGRNAGKLKPWAVGLPHVVKPDLDNLIKAAKDAVGAWDHRPALVWTDDCQANRYIGEPLKRYVRGNEKPGMIMCIRRADVV